VEEETPVIRCPLPARLSLGVGGHTLFFLLLGACASPEPQEPPAEPTPAEQEPLPGTPALPAGFQVKGKPEVREPFLPPASTWRWLVSGLRLYQAEGKEILVTFEERAFHTTDRQGRRQTFRLPEGLRLLGTPSHVLLKPDLSLEVPRESGMQVVGEEEVSVVTARFDMGRGNVQEFRLVAKGGVGFRSISTGGDAG
jgi:hypothetical protein